jgi:hypothetical protein
MNNAAITCAYLYIWDHILLCSYDDLQLDTADQQRINQLLNQRLEEQNLQNFGLRYLSRKLIRQGEKGKTTVATETLGVRMGFKLYKQDLYIFRQFVLLEKMFRDHETTVYVIIQ